MRHIVALSGGKDSTAMALRLAELNPTVEYEYICTPTGDELPEMLAHWDRLECMLGRPLQRLPGKTLRDWINFHNALPSFRMRWCTRQLKIEPCIAYFKRLPADSILYVGLRADEEERKGLISGDIPTLFPLREWGWGIDEVKGYLREKAVKIPSRTDCARCYGQRLSEWFNLWRDHPDIFADAVADEVRTGHTFRSPQRDTWPTSLAGLAERFAEGHVPRGASSQPDLFGDEPEPCRVCRL
jgi:hypothetical protein